MIAVELLFYYKVQKLLLMGLFQLIIIPQPSPRENKSPTYFKSRPAVNILPSPCKITALTFSCSLIFLNVFPISSKNGTFMAFKAFGLEMLTLIILPSSNSSYFKVDNDITLIIQINLFEKIFKMSATNTSVMKAAQIQKTKQSISLLVEWYAKKEEFFKKYVPIQISIIKRLFNAPENTLNRLREIAQLAAEEKQIQAITFEKSEKFLINNEAKFLPQTQQKIDPKDPKGQSKIKVQLPSWCNNIDRVLLSMSRTQKQRRSRIKAMYKTLDTIQSQMKKEEERYMSELKREQKELQKHFEKLDKLEKQQSKCLAKILKESKGQNLKDSSFFISEMKNIQTNVHGEFEAFVERNNILVKLIQLVLKAELNASKKVKEQLTIFLTYKRDHQGKQTKAEEQIWGFLAISQQKVHEQRLKYFNAMLLRQERVDSLKQVTKGIQFKNNLQIINKFLHMTKTEMMDVISANQSMIKFFSTISYRCWPDISLAQGWLIQSYAPAVIYMTYDYNMIMYSKQGILLKKIHTTSSKVDRVEGNILFLKEKIKGFFSDSIQQYKIKFQDGQRLQQFQLFMQNQIK